MKVREVRFQHIRGFGEGLRCVPFYDPDTDQVRPLSVLVGSNGCGKTTVLEMIEGMLCWEAYEQPPASRRLLVDVMRQGYAAVQYRLDEPIFPASQSAQVWLEFANSEHLPSHRPSVEPVLSFLRAGKSFGTSGDRDSWENWRDQHERGRGELRGGLLYFPHNRWFEQPNPGTIRDPQHQKQWMFHFEPHSKWEGSLAEFWVWQNYLDLEAAREGRPNLLPFIELIEQILGRGRRVVIHKARVHIQDGDRRIEPHELPSGEQQILTLFGEILRQLRPGAIILIDEIEISLHPALQRAVLAHLRNLARLYDLQIIVTTHSMDIVRSVSPREIVNLDDMVLSEPATPAVAGEPSRGA